ncbi:AAA family ATPase [Microbacterium radiodurans]|uniref:Nuclease SbcCD subunit C n=1 Tax=Microbacterium radiodurans TaxID=661398 RepID=A0A5J5IXC9_9MICO|nr:SMC family ATPase [Microbacterium radiodurans]KAA9089801.1 SMC family ATPase [Microbacterium radiodurans]
MKLHRIELEGFGPFRERQVVDFDAFDDDGVFLISGRTGAGKSSILDGVSFALYGAVPRYDSGERRLRSDHSFLGDPTEVRLEFTVGAQRWRVTRSPDYERPAKRGDKLTTEAARAELEESVDGVWIGRAAKPREVGVLLDEILGLNAQQFQQVILLAQNKFSRFLLARNDERQQLLRTLFGTRRFERYKEELEDRRRAAQRELEDAGAQTRTLLEVAEAALAAAVTDADAGDAATGDAAAPAPIDLAARRSRVERAAQRAEYRIEQTAQARAQRDAEHATAVSVHAELVERARVFDELEVARVRMDRLDAEAPRRAEEARRLDRARTAEALRAPLELAVRAESALDEARELARVADERWVESGGAPDDDLAALDDELTGDIARWTDAAERERELIDAAAERERREAAAADLTAQLAALIEQHALVPAERERIETELATTTTDATRLDDLLARRAELSAQLAAAQEAAALADRLAAADADHLAASARSDTAGAAVTDLLRRRLTGRAAELAAGLAPGAPCPVCGAAEHPHPAPPADDPVTDDDIARAEADRDAAHAVLRERSERVTALRAAHADAAARSGGRSTAELEASSGTLADEVSVAERARARAAELSAQRGELDRLDAAAAVERARLDEAIAAARAAVAVAESTVARLEREVGDARGTFASVAERLAAASARREVARTAAEARAVLAGCERAAADAATDRAARVAASDFDDADAVAAALLPADETASLAARLAERAADVAATRARLLELELAAAGEGAGRPDLDASAHRLAAADEARSLAIAAHRDAVHDAERLRELIVRIDAAFAAVGARAETTATVTRLADTVAGRAPNTRKMDLETFVLAAELEEIVTAANLRLQDMSSGRYTLYHSDALQARGAASGLALEVLDAYTGRLRSPQSLSGGETFLASLALALGLAEVVTGRAGGIRLDTLFIDEGFGSLDPETLELAMRTLDELRAGGRTVGVISHVEAMKEQLPAQVLVEATPEGPSAISQREAMGAG